MFRPEYSYMEIIVGPMFSGKSEELIRRVKRAIIAKQKVFVFKPKIDDRYSKTDVVSHNGETVEGHAVVNSEEILKILENEKDVSLVAIDEVQFFDEGIIDVVEELVDRGIRVAMSGLDQDFRGEPFDITAKLLAKSEFITKLQAVCMKCGKPATKSQRIVNGKPASFDAEIIQIGEKETYEPRCRSCHEVGKKKNRKEKV